MKLQRKLTTLIFAAAVAVGAAGLVVPVSYAECSSAQDCVRSGVDGVGSTGSSATSVSGIIQTVVNVMLFLLGAVCVVMIVIGGIRYATSQGDQSGVSSAKNTILYAVVGLVVAVAAYAIVNFVVEQFVDTSGARSSGTVSVERTIADVC